MNKEFDFLIVGGGVVGLTVAIALDKRGQNVGIIDAGLLKIKEEYENDDNAFQTRVYAINAASENLLISLGVWNLCNLSRITSYNKMQVWDGVTKQDIDFNSHMIAKNSLGKIIEEQTLKNALLKKIKVSGITLFSEDKVNDLEIFANNINVITNKGAFRTKLLIAADGALSKTRNLLKVPITTWPYYQEAIVANVIIEKPHQNTAYQVFNPDGPLALLPLKDKHQCSIVWSTERATSLKKLSIDDFNDALNKAFGNKLGKISLLSERISFPLHMRHAKQYVGNNWLLLGDAAHSVHPLAGLGLNIGLADVAEFLDLFDKKNLITPKLLGAYQRQRKHAVWQIILTLEGLKMLFGNSIAPITKMRGLGLAFCNKLPFLKRWFIQQANI